MTTEAVLDIGLEAITLGAKLAAPLLITALVIGLVIGLLQSITQVQEMSLSFVPKLIGVGVALLVCAHWMMSEAITFTTTLFDRIPQLLSGG